MITRLIRCLLLPSLVVVFGAGPLVAQPNLEYGVKSAFLYNFIRFIDWPAEAFAGPESPYIIGVLGRDDRFTRQLESVVRGKTIDGRPLEVRSAPTMEALDGTHILYIDQTAREEQADVLAALAGRSVVTVGETADFMEAGGIIRFFVRDRKVAFEIHPQAAEKAGLRISSRLLSLADIYPEPGGGR